MRYEFQRVLPRMILPLAFLLWLWAKFSDRFPLLSPGSSGRPSILHVSAGLKLQCTNIRQIAARCSGFSHAHKPSLDVDRAQVCFTELRSSDRNFKMRSTLRSFPYTNKKKLLKHYSEEWRFLRYKTPVRTSQETHYVSTTESSQLMLCKIADFHGGLWRMASSGTLHRVALVRTKYSELLIVSTIRVARIDEQS
jgi:hypothetical protein